MTNLLSIILAAGEGTRMRSAFPKVMHLLGGRPLLSHVLHAAQAAGSSTIAVVVGPDHDSAADEIHRVAPEATIATQPERLGTGHAVLQTRSLIEHLNGHVVVLLGDAPLISADTIAGVTARLDAGADIAVVGFEAADPTGYGRLLTEGESLVAIREHRDASEAERAIALCNSGIMGFRAETLRSVIDRIENHNARGEFYLTDAIALAHADGRKIVVTRAPESEVQGINDRSQLAKAEAQFQAFKREEVMAGGVTLRDPASVYFSWDTSIGRDSIVEPHVVFGPGVTIAEGVRIRAFCHIEGATIGSGASIGPFARLRPGAELGAEVKIGNFAEVKNSVIGEGTKIPHLSYIGDADVGANTELGAGIITCNYDGVNKNRTTIGAGAFIGSNTSLVAPVTIGSGVYVGSGSVITEDVPDEALAIARARQVVRPNYAEKIRARAEERRKVLAAAGGMRRKVPAAEV